MTTLSARELTLLQNAVDEVASMFDVLIIDTGAGIGSNAVTFASSAEDVLLVATPDPTSMRDAYAMAKVLNRRSGVDKMYLVSNQVANEAEGGQLHMRLDAIVKRFLTLDLAYLGCLPSDEIVRNSVASGQPFVLRAPRSAPARAMENLARRLCAEQNARDLC